MRSRQYLTAHANRLRRLIRDRGLPELIQAEQEALAEPGQNSARIRSRTLFHLFLDTREQDLPKAIHWLTGLTIANISDLCDIHPQSVRETLTGAYEAPHHRRAIETALDLEPYTLDRFFTEE